MWNQVRLAAAQVLFSSVFAGLLCLPTEARASDDELSDALPPAIHPTRLDYSKFDAPEAVTVISQEDIRLAGYVKLSELFRSVPGFRMVNVGDESRVSYHGTAARHVRRMLVTIDGRSVLVGDSQYVEFDRLPIGLDDIARVVITRGPNGAAFGDNAFLVSIDFQTVGRDDPKGLTLRAAGGHNDRHKVGATLNERLGSYDLALSASAVHDGGYDYADAEGTPRNDGTDIRRAQLSLEREMADRSRWRLDANLYDSENKTGIRALSFTGTQKNDGQFIALSNRREIGESSRLDWFVSYNHQHEAIRQVGCYTPDAIARTSALVEDPVQLAGLLAPTLIVPSLLGVSLSDTCFFTDLNIDSRRNELEVEYESQRGPWRYLLGTSAIQTDAKSAQYFAGQRQTQRSYRLFGESAVALGDVHVSLGAMGQASSNVDKKEFAWRGALSWQFEPNQAIRYSYARSFRVPSLRESEIAWSGAFYFGRRTDSLDDYPVRLPLPLVTSSFRLRPETIESHALGYFGTFFNSSTTVDVKVFTEGIRDPVESSLFYFSPPPANGASFTVKGLELETALPLSERWRLSGQYSYLDNNTRDPIERELQSRHAGSLLVTYRPSTSHAFTLGYYGNSTISGHHYNRYDLVYNYSRALGRRLLRSQLVWQHHLGGGDGIRDPNPLTSNEGYFAHLDQVFLHLEVAL